MKEKAEEFAAAGGEIYQGAYAPPRRYRNDAFTITRKPATEIMKPFSLDHLTDVEFEEFCFDLLIELAGC